MPVKKASRRRGRKNYLSELEDEDEKPREETRTQGADILVLLPLSGVYLLAKNGP